MPPCKFFVVYIYFWVGNFNGFIQTCSFSTAVAVVTKIFAFCHIILASVVEGDIQAVFELHGSQSTPGPGLTCYDGPHTMRKIPGTQGATFGPSLLCSTHKKYCSCN